MLKSSSHLGSGAEEGPGGSQDQGLARGWRCAWAPRTLTPGTVEPGAGYAPAQTTEPSPLREGPPSTQGPPAGQAWGGPGRRLLGRFLESGAAAGGRRLRSCQTVRPGRRAELHAGGRGRPAPGPRPAAGRKPAGLTSERWAAATPDAGGAPEGRTIRRSPGKAGCPPLGPRQPRPSPIPGVQSRALLLVLCHPHPGAARGTRRGALSETNP